jgi:hypothetical protein
MDPQPCSTSIAPLEPARKVSKGVDYDDDGYAVSVVAASGRFYRTDLAVGGG